MIMGKQKEMDLRKTCLKKNYLRAVESGIRYIRDVLNQMNAEAPSHCTQVLSESDTFIGKQLSATQHAEQKSVVEIPSKRLLEVDSQTLMPKKKKRRTSSSKHAPNRKRPFSDLDVLPQIKIPVSQKPKQMPQHVYELYVKTQSTLKRVQGDVKSFFEDDDNSEKCNIKASTPDILSAVDGDLVFKEVSSFKERHEYKKFYNRNLLLGQRLKYGIESSNKCLSLLRQAIKALPVYPHDINKLITMFNTAFLSYTVNPVHEDYKTVCRHLVLVKTLIIKFNNKHGLPSKFVPNLKQMPVF